MVEPIRRIQPQRLAGVDPSRFLEAIRQQGSNANSYTASMAARKRIEAERAKELAAQNAADSYTQMAMARGEQVRGRPAGISSTPYHQGKGGTTSAAWKAKNAPGKGLVTINTAGGRITVHRDAAAAFQGFLKELTGTGYKIKSIGGYANRQNVNNPSKKSHHAYGTAIDINPATNPNLRGRLVTDMPQNISQMAAKYGLSWGGDWRSVKDSMHFEYLGY